MVQTPIHIQDKHTAIREITETIVLFSTGKVQSMQRNPPDGIYGTAAADPRYIQGQDPEYVQDLIATLIITS
jgi:hypothetical protein